MAQMFIFGLGYSAKRVKTALNRQGWHVTGTGRNGDLAFADEDRVRRALRSATHVLSCVPPADDADPVLARYGDALEHEWLGYLSSTGVYGDAAGAWVDESAPVGHGRRTARTACEAGWLARAARVFRLPGIYGPDRSALDRVRKGRAHRIDLPGQVFSRIHVDDIARGVIAGFDGPAGAYNLSDDCPASQNAVIEEACRLLGIAPPPVRPLDESGLPPKARAFYTENRRVANGKARRVLGWKPLYPDYRAGLRAVAVSEAGGETGA